MTLEDLGNRICILGPPASGKSTLTDAIGRARCLPPVHLDQLSHLPGTDWKPRPEAEFVALHDHAIEDQRWVMDGNYIWLLPQRLVRATGVILLDLPTVTSLFRYLRRCWFDRSRPGALEGGRDSATWDMIRHIVGSTKANRTRDAALFSTIDLPKASLTTPRAFATFYCTNALQRRPLRRDC